MYRLLETSSDKAEDKNLVSGTLNALANKLWYMAHATDTNLTGKVGIAEGLTTRSVSKTITVGSKTYNVPAEENLKDITWKENGQGQYEYTPEQEKPPVPQEQDVDTFTTPITGDTDQEYVDHHVKKENGLYQFTKDTILKASANNPSAMIQISSGKKVTVDASGKELHFDGSGKDNIFFVNNGSTDEIQLTAKKLQLIANTDNASFIAGFVNHKGTINGDVDMKFKGGNNSFVYGFKQINDWTVNGNVTFNGEGKDVALFDSDNKGSLTFNKDVSIKVQGHGDGSNGNARGIHINEGTVHVKGNLNMAGSGDVDSWGIDNSESALKKNIVSTVGLYAGGNSFNAGVESRIQVDGNTSITSTGSGVISEGLGAIVDLRGDVDIRVKKSDGVTNYAVYSKGGKALINVKENGEELTPGDKNVVLVGDIALEGKNNLNSRMYMALINENSSWTGAIQSALKADLDKIGAAAHGQIYLQNGAQWNHIHQSAMGGDSIVQSFVGGDTNQTYGVI